MIDAWEGPTPRQDPKKKSVMDNLLGNSCKYIYCLYSESASWETFKLL